MLQEQSQREARELISEFEKDHDDDWEALLVIEAWREGHDGPAIREKLGSFCYRVRNHRQETASQGEDLP